MSEKVATYVAGSPVSSHHQASRSYRSMREAVNAAAHSVESIKVLAADLDMSPSALSMATVLSDGENARPFPAEKLADLCSLTGNYSPVLTLCEQLGYHCIPTEQVKEITAALNRYARELEGKR